MGLKEKLKEIEAKVKEFENIASEFDRIRQEIEFLKEGNIVLGFLKELSDDEKQELFKMARMKKDGDSSEA